LTIQSTRDPDARSAHAQRKSSATSKIPDAFLEKANKNVVAALALLADLAASKKAGVFLSIRDSDLKKILKNAIRPGMPGRRQGPLRESSATRASGDAFARESREALTRPALLAQQEFAFPVPHRPEPSAAWTGRRLSPSPPKTARPCVVIPFPPTPLCHSEVLRGI
jgi:hypothetical protein